MVNVGNMNAQLKLSQTAEKVHGGTFGEKAANVNLIT
jgi:hypothetical protein